TLTYPNIPSVIHPVPHSLELPIPNPPASYTIDSDNEYNSPSLPSDENMQRPSKSQDTEFVPDVLGFGTRKITQPELNDFVRDLDLPKNTAELLDLSSMESLAIM
ncbi:hypothetical protein C0J52_01234, partial [Blattella germanica]